MSLCACVQRHDKQQNFENCIRFWLLHQGLHILCILKCLTMFPLYLTKYSNAGAITQWLGLCLGRLSLLSVTGSFGCEGGLECLFSQSDIAQTGSRDGRKGIWINISSHEGRHLKQFNTSLALYCCVGIKNQPKSWWEA